ncbi:MAG TPA: hypothetical protein PLR99_08800 [Polyangiaceae bacterium]|nr:hypothetical protein [Polyangiaceae bacterium]
MKARAKRKAGGASPAWALVFLLGSAACGDCRGRQELAAAALDGAPEASDADAGRGDGGADLPARCEATTAELALEGGASLEVGDAHLTPAGLALSATIERDGSRVGVVFLADPALAKLRTLDLGDLAGGELAPRLFAHEGAVLVASYVRGSTPKSLGNRPGAARVVATRTLAVAELGPERATPLFRVAQQADDSLAFDLVMTGKASGLVAWDEDSDRVVRGVVKVASFADGRVASPSVATPYETDADSPGLLRAVDGQLMLAWLARDVLASQDGGEKGAPEPDRQGDYLETAGEERARQWVQLAPLDAAGKLSGPIVSVTPRTRSHATAFELAPAAAGGADVYVYDAVLRGEREGARLLRVPVRGGKVLPSEELLAGGVGASPSVLGPGLVGFVDLAERSMLFSSSGAARVLTREPLARGGRFVAASAGVLYSVSVEVGADGGAGRAWLRRHTCP